MASAIAAGKAHRRCQSCGGSAHNSPIRTKRRNSKSDDCNSVHSEPIYSSPKEIRIIAGKNTVSVTFTDDETSCGSVGKFEIPSRLEKRTGTEMSSPSILRKESSNDRQIQIPSEKQRKPVSVSVPGISVSVSAIKSEGDLTRLKPYIGNLTILRGEPYSSHSSVLRRRRLRHTTSLDRDNVLNCLDEVDELSLDKSDDCKQEGNAIFTRRPLLKFAGNNEDSDSSSYSSGVSHIEPQVKIAAQNLRCGSDSISSSTSDEREIANLKAVSAEAEPRISNGNDPSFSDTTNSTPSRSPRIRKLRWKNDSHPGSTESASSSGYESQAAKWACASKQHTLNVENEGFRSPRTSSKSPRKVVNMSSGSSDCSVKSAPGSLNSKHVRWYGGEPNPDYRTLPLEYLTKKKDKKRRQKP